MSNRIGATAHRVLPGTEIVTSPQGAQCSPPKAFPPPPRSQRAARRMVPMHIVLAAIVALAIGAPPCASTASAAAAERRCAFPSARQASSTLLLVAQDQSSAASPEQTDSAKVPLPTESQQESPPPAAPAPHPRRRAPSRSVLNQSLSNDLSQYLHQHHLPYVDALVFGSAAGTPTSVTLDGQVRTEHGKEDAETKSRDFTNAPDLRIQNHIEVNASLALNPSAASSAPVESAPATGAVTAAATTAAPATSAADPCTDLCLKDEGHCNSACQTQAAGGAAGGGLSVQGLLGQFGQSATQLKQCNEDCQQTREHCVYQCSSGGGSAQASEAPAAPPDGAGPPPGAAENRPEGPDTPPE
jgi:hypothetical protein